MRSIKILNPAGGVGWTNRKRAKAYVRRGRARWIDDGTIQFIESDSNTAAIASARLREIDYDRAARTGCASLDAIRNLPMVGPIERLYVERRRAA